MESADTQNLGLSELTARINDEVLIQEETFEELGVTDRYTQWRKLSQINQGQVEG